MKSKISDFLLLWPVYCHLIHTLECFKGKIWFCFAVSAKFTARSKVYEMTISYRLRVAQISQKIFRKKMIDAQIPRVTLISVNLR